MRHVQALHRHEAATGRSLNTDSTAKYRAGFTQCAAEVSKFLAGVSGLPSDLHTRILAHLSSYNCPESHAVKPEATAVKALTPTGSSAQQKEAQQGPTAGVPLIQARLTSGQLALVLPSWTTLPAGSSPPNTAASPESAGAPSSPEAARGSTNALPDFHEGHPAPDVSPAGEMQTSSRLHSSLGHTSPPLVTSDPQTAPQVAPLDLATPHRRCSPVSLHKARQRSAAESKGENPPSSARHEAAPTFPRPPVTVPPLHRGPKCAATTSKSSGQCQELRLNRHAPYPSHSPRPPSQHQHQQNPHWRPW